MNPPDELPEHESFYNLDVVFEGLTSLRPKALTARLTSCRKIKVHACSSCLPTGTTMPGASI